MARLPLTAALLSLAIAGCGSSAPASDRAERPCDPAVSEDVLPAWARTGFSEPRPRVPHVLGRSGRIAAILFRLPLEATTGPALNKVLWVPRTVPTDPVALRVSAQRMDGRRAVGAPVTRVLEQGPGPSSFDLPGPGCWRLSLRWGDRTDELDLRYAARRAT